MKQSVASQLSQYSKNRLNINSRTGFPHYIVKTGKKQLPLTIKGPPTKIQTRILVGGPLDNRVKPLFFALLFF